jgi:hypothetical protein
VQRCAGNQLLVASAACLAPPAPQAGWPLPSACASSHRRRPPAPCAFNCVTAAHHSSRSPPPLAAAPHPRRRPGVLSPLAAPARLIALDDYIFSASCCTKLHSQAHHCLTSSLSRSPGIFTPPLPQQSSAQVNPIKSFFSESSLTGTFCPLPSLTQSLALSLSSRPRPPPLPRAPPTSAPSPPLPVMDPLSRLRAAIRRNQTRVFTALLQRLLKITSFTPHPIRKQSTRTGRGLLQLAVARTSRSRRPHRCRFARPQFQPFSHFSVRKLYILQPI